MNEVEFVKMVFCVSMTCHLGMSSSTLTNTLKFVMVFFCLNEVEVNKIEFLVKTNQFV